MSFLLSLVFPSTKLENKRVEQVLLPGSRQREREEYGPNMYTYVSK
jgi:hypothetical protein